MPPLSDLRKKTADNPNSVFNGGSNLAPAPITPENLVQIPAAAPLDLPVPMPQRGVFPPNMVMVSDRSDSTRVFRGPNTRSAVFQTPPQPSATAIVAAISTPTAAAAAIEILVNNQAVADQKVLNFLNSTTVQFVAGANGQISANAPSSLGDGLTHATPPFAGSWETDPAYNIFRDDFHGNLSGTLGNSVPLLGIGQLGWVLTGSIGTHGGFIGGGPLNMGAIAWDNASASSNSGLLALAIAQGTDSGTHSMHDGCWALFENPGWAMSFVFKVDSSWVPGAQATLLTQKSIYVGLVGPSTYNVTLNGDTSRPPIFFGVRYDTDPGVQFVVTQATASTGSYTLTGTFTGGGTNNFDGQKFVVTGFVNSNNNGTFLCTGSTTTTLTLANASGGTNESHSATATTPVLNDTTFVLEAVENAEYPTAGQTVRNNTQGMTLNTGITPAVGVWHRLDILCNGTGSITMTLDGTASLQVTVPKFTMTATATEQLSGSLTNDVINLTMGALNPASLGPWGPGSVITVSGFTGVQGFFNNTWTATRNNGGAASFNIFINSQHANIVGGATSTGIVTGYPVVTPACLYGNDSSASPQSSSLVFYVDYFAFGANVNFGPNAPGTPNQTLPRYF